MTWYMYAEEPRQSFRYAGSAAHLAIALRLAGKPDLAAPYMESAKKAYAWAAKNLRPGDEAKIRDDRNYAAASLFKATGDKRFEDQFKRDLMVKTADTSLSVWNQYEQAYAVYTYVTTDQPDMDKQLKTQLTRAVLDYADRNTIETAEKRGFRIGYDWYIPMFWGTATVPKTQPLMVAHALTKDPKYLAYYHSALDFFLGGNPLNMTWITGVGARSPHQVMHIDTWYRDDHEPPPGLVPMGPFRYQAPGTGPGPWDPKFAMAATYPDARLWPSLELWFEDRLCPPTNEFVTNNSAAAAAAYGYLLNE